MASRTTEFAVGSRVLTGVGFAKKGEIKFIGETSFSTGEWIGIRLDTADGKNDGSVGDVKYFDCDPLHGIFVRSTQVKLDTEEPTAGASARERLNLLREKRSSMLKSAGVATAAAAAASTSSIPSLKTSASSNSLTGSIAESSVTPPARTTRSSLSVNLGASSGSTSTAGRSGGLPSTPPRATATATVAPTKSRLTAPVVTPASAVPQTPAAQAPRSRTDKFTAPTPAASALAAPSKRMSISASSKLAPPRETATTRSRLSLAAPAATPARTTRSAATAASTASAAVPTAVEEPVVTPPVEEEEDEEIAAEEEADVAGEMNDETATESEPVENDEAVVVEEELEEPAEEPTNVGAEEPEPLETATEEEEETTECEATAAESTEVVESVEEEEQQDEQENEPTPAEEIIEERQEEEQSEDLVEEEPEEVPAPVSMPAKEAAPAPAPAAPVLTPSVEKIEPASSAPVVKSAQLASAANVVPVKQATESVSFSTPIKTAPGAVGADSTAQSALKRVPSAHTQRTPGAEATPSKDAALIQFLQTSIYKLNEEKDEMVDRIALLNQESAKLNAHLDASNNLATSLQDDLEHAHSQSQTLKATISELKTEMEQSKLQGKKEIATLQERIKTLENTPPPKDPRLPELERQVAELNSMVESLTLDKEQLTVEQEELDEKYLQCQIDLEEALAEVQSLKSLGEAQAAVGAARGASATVGAGGEGEDLSTALAALKIENDKLREALRRLNTVSVQDKQTLASQTSRLTALETEATELRLITQLAQAYKRQAEGDLAALQSSVDSMATFEEMIETLAGKNMDLSEQLTAAQETIRDLEDSAELTDEIDQQQRAQIDADRAALDALAVQLASSQQHLAEKDKVLGEHQAALDRVKGANRTLKAEVQRLSLLLSSEFQESKQLETKLKELASLRANQELLATELQSLYQRNLHINSQKHKYQALYTRMDSIFGGTAVFIEESKLINTEIAFVSAVTSGLEACRGLGSVLDVLLQTQPQGQSQGEGPSVPLNWDLLVELSASMGGASIDVEAGEVKIVPTLGKLYVLLLQAQGYAMQCNLDLFRSQTTAKSSTTATSAVSARTVQNMIDLKARFEVAAQLSSLAKGLCAGLVQEYRAHCSGAANTQALLDASAEDADASMMSTASAPAEAGVFVPSEGSLAALMQLMGEFHSLLGDLVTHMAPVSADPSVSGDCMDLIQNLTLLSSGNGAVSSVLKVELLYMSMNALCDVALQQLDTDSSFASSPVLLALRSMKVDIKASIFNLKSNTSHFVEQLPDLTGNYQLFVSCFADAQGGLVLDVDASGTESMVKLVQNFIRKVNTAPGLSASVSSTQQLLLGTAGVTRYLPYLLLTNAVSVGDNEQHARLREQFDQQNEKYWLLTMQTNSDLLVSTVAAAGGSSGATAEPSSRRKSVLDISSAPVPSASSGTSSEVSWRQRVVDARGTVAAKFGAPNASGEDADSDAVETAVLAGTPVKALPSISGAKLQSLLNELDIKKDELRAAMERCEDLQTQLDTALENTVAEPTTGGTRSRTRGGRGAVKTPAELQDEIKTLNEALFILETEKEKQDQEVKLMKSQLALQSTLLGSSSSAGHDRDHTGGHAQRGGGRKRHGAHSAAGAADSVSLVQYQTALEITNHWKAMALKRLTASLMPLPTPVVLTSTPNQVGTDAGDSAEGAAQPKFTTDRPVLSFKHLAVLPSSGKATALGVLPASTQPNSAFGSAVNEAPSAAEYAALYQNLRLARATSLRIKSLVPPEEKQDAAGANLAVASANVAKKYAVPTPAGGRTDVHGWLILPIDQPLPTDNTTAEAIDAWYSHHVPEFFTDSPHNFQIIIRGSLVPTSSIEGELYPIDIPHPPADELVTYEYSFTPPSPFSLNNLLNGDIKKMNGMYYNGSFDTPYERIPQSLATLVVKELTTAVYLDEHETQSYPNLRYLSYPRSTVPAASGHFYFAHEIHAQPDFDHIVHGTVADCVSPAAIPNEVLVNVVSRPGASWEIVGTENVLENKLVAGQRAKISFVAKEGHAKLQVSCDLLVLESLHCMIGPGFMDNC